MSQLLNFLNSFNFPILNINHFKTFITMKKENLKAVINFIITVLTAITSAFCVSSCQNL